MEFSIEAIIYYLIAIDAVFAAISAWTGLGKETFKKLGPHTRYFPITRGWATLYLALVIWLGCALSRLDIIGIV